MKKDRETQPDDEMREEYDRADLKGGVRGKYVDRFPRRDEPCETRT